MTSQSLASPDRSLPWSWCGFSLATAVLLLASTGCQTMGFHRANGTALGALTGTAIGAAVGDHAGGRTVEGALIGGLTGAALGNQVGDSMDRAVAFQSAQEPRGLTTGDIIRLHQSGAAADIIARQIDVQGMQSMLTVDDVLALQQSGVEPAVIQAAQLRGAPRPPQRSACGDWSNASAGPTIIAIDPGCPPPVFYRPPVQFHWRW